MHRRNQRARAMPLLACMLAAALLVSGCVLARQPVGTSGQPGGTPGPGGGATSTPPVIGQQAPSGVLWPLAGGETRTFPDSFTGRAVMMGFFSVG